MEKTAFQFALEGTPVTCEPFGHGHINRTYCIGTDRGERYILQRISRRAFRDIDGLMENIAAITAELSKRSGDPRSCLRLIPTREGANYFVDGGGEAWRVFNFIEGSICLQAARTPADFYQSGVGFGRFQNLLRDYPAERLHETIPGFHDTPARFGQFHEALAADPLGRAEQVRPEIDFLLAREGECGILQEQRDRGELPLRVTHNDTKLNNVLLDAGTGEALCVIDLDTVMPGLVAHDFGDAIRFGASTGAEDERDLEKIGLSLPLFEAFADGFIPACGGLTPREIETLPLGAKIITLEQAARFLADYIGGDVYYAVSRPEHNLDRARTQIRLVQDMENKWSELQGVIGRYMP